MGRASPRAPLLRSGVPYQRAVRWAGSRARLHAGQASNTVANWKHRGVPWGVLGPILVERLAAGNGTTPRAIVPTSRRAGRAFAALEQLALRTQTRGTLWSALETLLDHVSRAP